MIRGRPARAEGGPKVSKRLHHQAQERQTQGRERQPSGTLQRVSLRPFARPFRLLAAPVRTLPSEAEAVEVRNSGGFASLSALPFDRSSKGDY